MKFLPSFITVYTTIYITLLLTVNLSQACEQSCRDGISTAFCNCYIQEWNPIFDDFSNNLIKNLYNGLNDNNNNDNQIENSVNIAVLNQVNKSRIEFSNNCKDIVQNSIFFVEPKFQGQCQNPLKVIQPKSGTNWTLSDCQNQDYICGNPPSICHFMDEYVKPRNVKLLKDSLDENASTNGNFTKSITTIVQQTVVNSGSFGGDQTKMDSFMGVITNNLGIELNQFANDFNNRFCYNTTNSTTSCDKYDDGIKSLLLSYP